MHIETHSNMSRNLQLQRSCRMDWGQRCAWLLTQTSCGLPIYCLNITAHHNSVTKMSHIRTFMIKAQIIYIELEIKDTTKSNTSGPGFTSVDRGEGGGGQLHTSIYNKRDDFNIFRSWVAIFQPRPLMASLFIRYARAWSSYGCFILRATRLSNKLLEQG